MISHCDCVVFVRRFLALCIGEARVRFDLQEPFRPRAPKSNEENSKRTPLSPSTLHLLSQ
ncbi:hypothetical protein M9458_030235, partial [Cirrhinus mrigala]